MVDPEFLPSFHIFPVSPFLAIKYVKFYIAFIFMIHLFKRLITLS